MGYFEMVELGRKLVLVGVIALIVPGSALQILIGLAVCVMSSYLSLILSPFKQASDGWLYNACLVNLFFTLFCGLLIRLEVDLLGREGSGDQVLKPNDTIGWILII